MSELSDAITAKALQPQAATNDGESMQNRPLADLIAADKYQRSVAAQSDPCAGLKFIRLKPPGAV